MDKQIHDITTTFMESKLFDRIQFIRFIRSHFFNGLLFSHSFQIVIYIRDERASERKKKQQI